MEFHQLRYVCAIADTGSFSRAAERCHVAQPSLSQQVLKLEEDLGSRLFDRLGRSVRLTEAGRAFLPHARSLMTETPPVAMLGAGIVSSSFGGSLLPRRPGREASVACASTARRARWPVRSPMSTSARRSVVRAASSRSPSASRRPSNRRGRGPRRHCQCPSYRPPLCPALLRRRRPCQRSTSAAS